MLVGVAVSSVLLTRVVVTPVTSVEPPVVMVDSPVMVDPDTEPLPVAVTDSVPEPLGANEVEKIVLVARVVVTTVPSLLVRVETTSVVEIGTKTPSVAEVELLEMKVVPIVVGTGEPSLFVTVKMISDAVTEAVPEPELVSLVVAVAMTVAVGDEAMAGS